MPSTASPAFLRAEIWVDFIDLYTGAQGRPRRLRADSHVSLRASSVHRSPFARQVYRTRDLAKADVFEYIEMFYNRTRRHSHLGGVSPEAFETASNRGL
jgi:transposase InsO family protein